jgi:3-oxoacyl-[acyl-carrier protein] reductase
MDLEERIVVVTGGATGLGGHLVRAAAGAGAHVVVADRDGDAASPLADAVRAGGGSAPPSRCDVTSEDDLVALVAVAEALGGVDVLVNNAGGWGASAVQYPDAPPEDWDAVLDLNLRAPMRALQLSLPGMRRRGRGAVVNVASSAAVERTAYGSPPYAVAKAGLVRLTTALAGLEREGVRVTCVVPGWIGLARAPAERAALDPHEQAALPALVPPHLVAEEVVRLVRDDAGAGTVVELLDGSDRRVVLPH